MTKPLLPIRLKNPGNRGLNLDQRSIVESPDWATKLLNCVLDTSRRIAARKGWAMLTSTGNHSQDTLALGEYVESSTETHIISAANNKIYSGTTTLVDESNPVGGLTTPTADDWLFLNFNGACIGIQQGHIPITMTGDGTDFQDVTGLSSGEPTGNAGVATHGRLFVSDSTAQVIHWCQLLDQNDWTTASDAGVLGLQNVWPTGLDEIVSIQSWENHLVVFGSQSVLLFTGLEDPTTNLALAGTKSTTGIDGYLTGDGAVSRDAVVSIGTDLIYLSRSGLRALSRGLQFSTLPMTSIAPQVRDQLITDVDTAITAGETIKMVYHRAINAILAKIGTAYWYFDVRNINQVFASQWSGIGWKAAVSSQGVLYLGQNDGVASYSTYLDNASTYPWEFQTGWLPLGQGGQKFVPKQMDLYVQAGANYALAATWTMDLGTTVSSTDSQSVMGITASQWGTAHWGTGHWGDSNQLTKIKYDMSLDGETMQLNFKTSINAGSFALQQIHLYGKYGRVAR